MSASSSSLRVPEHIGGGFALGRVHAHVQRFIDPEAEAARGLIELHRRHAQVGQSITCGAGAFKSVKHGWHIRE